MPQCNQFLSIAWFWAHNCGVNWFESFPSKLVVFFAFRMYPHGMFFPFNSQFTRTQIASFFAPRYQITSRSQLCWELYCCYFFWGIVPWLAVLQCSKFGREEPTRYLNWTWRNVRNTAINFIDKKIYISYNRLVFLLRRTISMMTTDKIVLSLNRIDVRT